MEKVDITPKNPANIEWLKEYDRRPEFIGKRLNEFKKLADNGLIVVAFEFYVKNDDGTTTQYVGRYDCSERMTLPQATTIIREQLSEFMTRRETEDYFFNTRLLSYGNKKSNGAFYFNIY